MRTTCLRWALVSLVAATPLAAQDTSHVAFVIGLGGPGLLVAVSPRLSLGVDVGASVSSASGIDNWTETGGVSAQLYMQRWDALRTLVGVRAGYAYTKAGGSDAVSKTPSGRIFFGTEYSLGRRFAVTGQAGVLYSRTTGSRFTSTGESIPLVASSSAGTFTGVGLLFRL